MQINTVSTPIPTVVKPQARTTSTAAKTPRSPQNTVRFGSDSPGSMGNIFSRFFLAIKAFLSKKSKDALDANTIEALNLSIDKLYEEMQDATIVRNEIVGSSKREEARYKEYEAIYQKELAEAEAADKFAQKQTDEKLRTQFEIIAGQEALQAEKALEEMNRQLEILKGFQAQAEAAKAQHQEIEAKLREQKQRIEQAKNEYREIQQLERLASLEKRLKSMTSMGLGSVDEASRLIERIKERRYVAQAALEGNEAGKTAEEVLARAAMREAMEKEKAQSALERLRAKRLGAQETKTEDVKTQTASSATGSSNPVADATKES